MNETVETQVETPVASEESKPKRKRSKKPKKAEKAEVKKEDGRGRPAVYTGELLRQVSAAIRKHGATGGIEALAEKGIKVSWSTVMKIAHTDGIELQRGRPAKFNGNQLSHIAALVRKLGVNGSLEELEKEGVEISRATVLKIAHNKGVKLHRGRPVTKEAA